MLTKNKHTQLLFVLLFALTGLWQPASVNAQSENGIEWVNVTISPEQGESSVLIVNEIYFSESLNFPQEVTFPMPTGCEVEKVTIQRSDGELLPIAWDLHDDGDWQLIHFAAVSSVALIQYRDSRLEERGSLRQYTYKWLANADVDLFSLTIYQPFGASELTLDPPLSQMEEMEDGRKIYSMDFGRITADDVVWLDIEYEKDITNPDFPAMKVSAISPIDEGVLGHSASPLSVVVWLVAVAAVVMILVAAYYWWISRKMRHKREHIVRGVGILNPEKQAVFCHECGSRSRAGDTYCRSCGTELRRF